VKVRLHGFAPLASVQATTVATTMECRPSASWIRLHGYECESGGKAVGRPRRQDDYVEIDLPAAMLTPDTARIELRWAEAGAVLAR
jgi:hypothetical protein